jgi:SNF2 family DNA or RNA helicase
LTDINLDIESCKADECIRVLKDLYEQKRKVIIFNKWTKSIEMLKAKIQKELPQITVYEYHGDCKATREDAKINFLASDHNSILIMSTAGSVGLNLQKADVMINYNRLYNPLAQYQAISRIYRMGQLNPVNIINITVENSVEDKILEILKTKKELFDDVVEDHEFFDELENLDVKELSSLLE